MQDFVHEDHDESDEHVINPRRRGPRNRMQPAYEENSDEEEDEPEAFQEEDEKEDSQEDESMEELS